MDLGTKMKSPGALPATPVGETEPKVTYPGFSLNDKVAEEFSKEYDCEVGDELTATVRLRVSGIRKDEYGNSKSFELLSMDNIAEVPADGKADEGDGKGNEEDSPEAAEEKVIGMKLPKKKTEAPDTSAASIDY